MSKEVGNYACYGLTIVSDLALPLPICNLGAEASLVSVSMGGFDAVDPGFELPYNAGGALYGPYAGDTIVRLKGVADFLVSKSSIRVGPSGCSEEELGDLVVRMALGFVVQLRSMLAFHGSAANCGGRAVAILGNRGAGKSTTVLGLAKRGWGLLCDDTVVIDPDGIMHRGAPRARLNADSYEMLMADGGSFADRLDRDGKHPVEWGIAVASALLKGVFLIEAAEVDEVQVFKARGHAKLALALGHMHSPEGIGDPGARLRSAAEALAHVPLYTIKRPTQRFALDELLDAIESICLREVLP